MSRSGFGIGGEQSIGVGCGVTNVLVGTECIEAVWNEGLEFCESEDRITMSCPNDEQFGFTVRVGVGCGSSEVSTRSMIVFSFLAVDWGMYAIVCSTISFFTVASACDLRMLRSGVIWLWWRLRSLSSCFCSDA